MRGPELDKRRRRIFGGGRAGDAVGPEMLWGKGLEDAEMCSAVKCGW